MSDKKFGPGDESPDDGKGNGSLIPYIKRPTAPNRGGKRLFAGAAYSTFTDKAKFSSFMNSARRVVSKSSTQAKLMGATLKIFSLFPYGRALGIIGKGASLLLTGTVIADLVSPYLGTNERGSDTDLSKLESLLVQFLKHNIEQGYVPTKSDVVTLLKEFSSLERLNLSDTVIKSLADEAMAVIHALSSELGLSYSSSTKGSDYIPFSLKQHYDPNFSIEAYLADIRTRSHTSVHTQDKPRSELTDFSSLAAQTSNDGALDGVSNGSISVSEIREIRNLMSAYRPLMRSLGVVRFSDLSALRDLLFSDQLDLFCVVEEIYD